VINNPVLRKELLLRFRMRQPTPTRIGLGLLITLGLGWMYWAGMSRLLSDASPAAGRDAWMVAIWIQYLIICLVAPSLTANAITQEKEQQTWEMLVFTRLQPAEIVLGKLLARLVTVGLILGICLPFTLFSWLHAAQGGPASPSFISPWQFGIAYLVMLLSALFFATLSLFLSLALKRTLYVIVLAYVLVIGVLCIGTALITALLSSIVQDYNLFDHSPLMWFNPIRLIWAAMAPNEPGNSAVLLAGLFGYAAATLLLLAHMITRFPRFAHE